MRLILTSKEFTACRDILRAFTFLLLNWGIISRKRKSILKSSYKISPYFRKSFTIDHHRDYRKREDVICWSRYSTFKTDHAHFSIISHFCNPSLYFMEKPVYLKYENCLRPQRLHHWDNDLSQFWRPSRPEIVNTRRSSSKASFVFIRF